MIKHNRFRDFTATFWMALLSSITAAMLAIAAYASMINDNTALLKASLIVICFEGGLITAMVVLNAKFQGLLKGWGFTLLFLIGMAEIFMASTEIQSGIMKAGANAEFVQQSANNAGSIAASLADATKGIADCNKRYPRKNKDAVARNNCVKPFDAVLKSSAEALPNGGAPKFSSEDAGKLKIWQSVADTMNEAWQPDVKITWERAAFYCMTAIMGLFVLVKNFLWAAYSREQAVKNDSATNQVEVPEHVIGQPVTDTATEPNNSTVTERNPFGFAPSTAAPSTAARNRATLQDCNYSTVTTERNTYSTVATEPNNSTVGTNSTVTTVSALSALNAAKAARIGSVVNCPQCGKQFVKNSHNHLYCSNNRKPRTDGGNCSDDWHNAHNPSRTEFLFKRRR